MMSWDSGDEKKNDHRPSRSVVIPGGNDPVKTNLMRRDSPETENVRTG